MSSMPDPRQARLALTFATSIFLTGCQHAVGDEPSAKPTSSAPESVGPATGAALRLRPVLAESSTIGCAGTGRDDPSLPMVACNRSGTTKYELGPSILDGSALKGVSSQPGGQGGDYVVDLAFRADGARTWAGWTAAHLGRQLAFVLDSLVLCAPSAQSASTDGNTQISDNFSEQDAQHLVQQSAAH